MAKDIPRIEKEEAKIDALSNTTGKELTSRPGYAVYFKFPHHGLEVLDLKSDGTYTIVKTYPVAPIANVFEKFKREVVKFFGV